ncbi:hypothetical protein NC652_035071 [Populus alba x Populus x berolinensis]|nr:hypothetical protein NC652_035071 [Populus alba x Populus x berolinensis]
MGEHNSHRCIRKSQSATLKGRDRLLIDSNNLIHFLLERSSSGLGNVSFSHTLREANSVAGLGSCIASMAVGALAICEAPKSKCQKSTHAVRFRTIKDHSRLGAYRRPRRSFKRKRLLINQV